MLCCIRDLASISLGRRHGAGGAWRLAGLRLLFFARERMALHQGQGSLIHRQVRHLGFPSAFGRSHNHMAFAAAFFCPGGAERLGVCCSWRSGLRGQQHTNKQTTSGLRFQGCGGTGGDGSCMLYCLPAFSNPNLQTLHTNKPSLFSVSLTPTQQTDRQSQAQVPGRLHDTAWQHGHGRGHGLHLCCCRADSRLRAEKKKKKTCTSSFVVACTRRSAGALFFSFPFSSFAVHPGLQTLSILTSCMYIP